MSDQSPADRDELREQAREYVENLPGETALGRVDPATVPADPSGDDSDTGGTGTGTGGTGTVGGPLDAAGGEVGGGTSGAADLG